MNRIASVFISNVNKLSAGKTNTAAFRFLTMSGKITSPSDRRGALIVFEGCDRSGKTTQCNLLLQSLHEKGHSVKLLKFPGIILFTHKKNTQTYHSVSFLVLSV